MSRANGRRVRVAVGIYEDRYGLSAVVTVAGFAQEEKRFPLGTHFDAIEAWRLERRAELLKHPDRPERVAASRRGSLAGDVPRFLDSLPEGSRKTDFAGHLAQWTATRLGDLPRGEITHSDVLTELATWQNAGLASSSLNHRVRALRELYRSLDPGASHPTDGIKRRKDPPAQARGIPLEFVALILAQMPDRGQAIRDAKRSTVSHTKIRLRVEAYTGLSHKSLVRLEARHFRRGKLHMQARSKGAGVDDQWIDLLPPAVEALTDYGREKLWGKPFSRSSVHKSWRRAIDNAIRFLAKEAADTGDRTRLELFTEAIPTNCRPYDLRHSFLTEAYRRTGDLQAVADLGQHANLQTTRRYTKGAVAERVAAAIAKMSERWAVPASPGSAPVPPAPAKRRRGLRLIVRDSA